MNLSKVEDPATEYASKYLQGRQCYILIRAVREFLVQTAQLSLWARRGLLWGEGGLQRALFSSHLEHRSSEEAEASSDEELELSLCLSKGRRTFLGQNHLPPVTSLQFTARRETNPFLSFC